MPRFSPSLPSLLLVLMPCQAEPKVSAAAAAAAVAAVAALAGVAFSKPAVAASSAVNFAAVEQVSSLAKMLGIMG